MREVPLEELTEAFAFGDRLLRGEFDCVVLLTGVGTRLLWKTLLAQYRAEELAAALGRVTIVVRGPKPSAAIRELGLTPDVQVPEPNTWRELLAVMQERPERRIALQEYGASNDTLLNGLRGMGKEVVQVRIYAWDLPEDTAPLRQAGGAVNRRRVRCSGVYYFDAGGEPFPGCGGRGDFAAGFGSAAGGCGRVDRPDDYGNAGGLRDPGGF